MKNDVATVTVVFSRDPGGPAVSCSDAVAWMEAALDRVGDCEGYNSLRYSVGRVVSASLTDKPTA